MKALLDHVGIAVRDLDAALAFYRDALGLEIELSEEVVAQRVRAHFIPAGAAKLELLEATAPASPIAKYLDTRGPGQHHIALRVDDIAAALDHLRARGVRLIDERPRPGAEGALVAFIHPSAAHGVLVELKQAPAAPTHAAAPGGGESGTVAVYQSSALRIARYTLGDLELTSLYDGYFRLDGGAMFGVVPYPFWSARVAHDERHRITLAMRPLLVRGVRTMLIDAGMGDKDDAKFHDVFGVDRQRCLDDALAEAGVSVEEIDVVLATHLHFDHAGGFTVRAADGRIRPRFPRARYVVRRGEWDDANRPHARNRASYIPDNFRPLADAGVLELVDEDQTIMPGVKAVRTGGHTRHHQRISIESQGQRAAYVADLVPTTAHLPDAWVMGYDLFPEETLAAKQTFLGEAERDRTLVFFPHDPAVAAGIVSTHNGRRTVQQAPSHTP